MGVPVINNNLGNTGGDLIVDNDIVAAGSS